MERKREDGPSYSQQSFREVLSLEGHGDLLSQSLSADHPAELAWLWLSHYSPNSACGGVRLTSQNFTMQDKGLKWQLSPSPGSTQELLAILQQTTVSLTLSCPPLFLHEPPPQSFESIQLRVSSNLKTSGGQKKHFLSGSISWFSDSLDTCKG